MNPFYKALDEGYSPEEVIGYFSKAIPQMAKSINKAKNAGYTIQQILGFLSKTIDPKQYKGMSESAIHESNRNNDSEMTKRGLAIAGTSIAAPIVANGVRSALSRALPAALAPQSPGLVDLNNQAKSSMNPDEIPFSNKPLAPTSQMPQEQSPKLNASISANPSQPPISPGNATLSQPINNQQTKEKTNVVDKLWSNFERGRDKGFDFESDAFLKIAKRMKSTGEIRSKEDFEKFFKIFDEKKNQGKNLPNALKEASVEYDNQRLTPNPEVESNELLKSDNKQSKEVNEPLKFEKKSIVSSPQGIGEVKEVRNGQAIIEIDGNKHKVAIDELEQSPLPEKDLADLYDELIGGIESETDEDVSRMVQWAGYNPETNTFQFLPHTGDLYSYDNISEEDAALLRDVLSVRKTSGSNFIGAWKKDSKSPIGAALSKLIKKLQSERGGKGNEYLAKHGTIYSAYEPAILAKKNKKKK